MAEGWGDGGDAKYERVRVVREGRLGTKGINMWFIFFRRLNN